MIPPHDAVTSAQMTDSKPAKMTVARRGSRCPTCGRPTVVAHRPFCSKRCRDVDLARWLGESYAIPAGPDDDEDGLVQEPDRA